MKVFIIELDDLEDAAKNWYDNFLEILMRKRLEFWNYFSHQFAIATPDDFTAKDILNIVIDCLGNNVQISVFEVNLVNYIGNGPSNFMVFFDLIKHPNYIPVWEREGDKPYGSSHILKMDGIPESLKRNFIES